MKSLGSIITFGALLVLVSCGKKNESGKSNNRYSSQYCVQYSVGGQCAQWGTSTITNINSPYEVNNVVSLNQVQQQNPCVASGAMGNMQRQQVSSVINMPTVITRGDIYIGVTSFGDVAAIIGNGTAQATFVAYLCPRMASVAALPQGASIGVYSGSCRAKPIVAANVYFTDGSMANFRDPRYGSSAGVPFSYCQ